MARAGPGLRARAARLPRRRRLTIGTPVHITGELLDDGTVVAASLMEAPDELLRGRLVGNVDLAIPPLGQLDPARKRRERRGLQVACTTIVVMAFAGLVVGQWLGNVAMVLLLVLVGWLVTRDLRNRRHDRREYDILAVTARERIRDETGITLPQDALRQLLGAGLERTGDPWHPTRPRTPTPVVLASDDGAPPLRLDITPKPLQPGTTATIAVTLAV